MNVTESHSFCDLGGTQLGIVNLVVIVQETEALKVLVF